MPNYTPGQRYQVDGQTATAGPDGVLYYDEPAASQPPPFIPAPPPQQPTPLAPGQAAGLRERGYVTPSGAIELPAAPTPMSEADRAAIAEKAAARERSSETRDYQAAIVRRKIEEANSLLDQNENRLHVGGINGPWTNSVLGASGWVNRRVPGSEANVFDGALDTIRSNLSIDALAEMRANSATGASGLGSLTDPERVMLSSLVASLDPAKNDAETMRRNLRQIDETMARFSSRKPEPSRRGGPIRLRTGAPAGTGGLGALGSMARPGPPTSRARQKPISEMTDAELQALAGGR